MKENHRVHAHGNSKVLCFSENGVYEVLLGTPHAWMASWMVGGCSLVECQWRVERVKLSIGFS